MSCTGMPSVMQQMVESPASKDSKMASAAKGGGTKITLAFAPVCLTASSTVSKTGTPWYSCPPLPGVTPATTLVPLCSILPVWNAPSLPVMPCTRSLVPSSTSIAMKLPSPVSRELYRPARRFQHRLLCDHVLRRVLGEDPASLFGVRTVETDDYGECDPGPLYGRQQPLRHLVAARYAAEDVDEHALDLLVGGDDIEGGRDLPGIGPSADVAEVGRFAAGLGDDVQRAHHQPRPVAEDADVAVELDVLQPDLLRPLLLRVCGLDVAQPGYLFVPVKAGVVHSYLRVQRQDTPFTGDDERVDLDQASVETLEGFVQVRDHHAYALGDISFQPRGEGDLTHLVRMKAEEWVYVTPDDCLGVGLCDLLDLHPALCGEQDQRFFRRPIHRDREVELPVYLLSVLDVDAPHGVPADLHTEDLPRRLFGLPRTVHHLDATSFAAASRKDLGFDGHCSPECLGGPSCLLRGPRDDARQRLQAVFPQQLFPLILVEIQVRKLPRSRP